MSDVQERPSCETCMWWLHVGLATGACHRHAPTPTVGVPGGSDTLWPLTNADDFCGDWQPQPVRQRTGRDMLLEAVQPLVEKCRTYRDADDEELHVTIYLGLLRRVRDAVENEGQRS